MLLFENIKLALAGIRANKMRSILTMLGIVIGISSVIAIMTVGDAVNKSVMDSMKEMGASKITAYIKFKSTYKVTSSEDDRLKDSDKISEEMLNAFSKKFDGRIDGIMLSNTGEDAEVSFMKKTAKAKAVAANSDYLKSQKLQMLYGRQISDLEQEGKKKVVVISDVTAEKLYPGNIQAALGNTIDVVENGKYHIYTVIGIYKYDPSANNLYMSSDLEEAQSMYIPLKTGTAERGDNALYSTFEVTGAKGEDFEKLSSDIANYFNSGYYENNKKCEISTYSMDTMLKESQKMLDQIKFAISAIAGISLIVGGIGVMNIMIVSVTERTKEIGTRMALGASRASIRIQFLTEAIVLCVIGGLLGIILGLGAGIGVSALMGFSGQPSVIAVIFVVLFSVAFGVFFGYYPADKASKLQPVEALRYE